MPSVVQAQGYGYTDQHLLA